MSTCRRSAPWKESEMARGPGGLGQPAAMKRQQWWRSRCPSKDCRCDREGSSDGASKREAEEGPGTQERRDAGVERRPVAEGESPPFGCGVDARVTRRTPRRCRRRGYRRWHYAGTSGRQGRPGRGRQHGRTMKKTSDSQQLESALKKFMHASTFDSHQRESAPAPCVAVVRLCSWSES